MPRLENWYRLGDGLVGQIYDDEKGRFEDGYLVATSRLVALDVERKRAVTQNTTYVLGDEAQPYAGENSRA